MAYGNFTLGLGLTGNSVSVAQIITATTAPVMGALTDAQVLADETGTDGVYASTAGTPIATLTYQLWNGSSWATTVAAPVENDVIRKSVSVTDNVGTPARVFTSGSITVTAAGVASEITALSVGTQTSAGVPATITIDASGTAVFVITTSATEPSVAQILAGTDHADVAASASGSLTISASGDYSIALPDGLSGSGFYLYMNSASSGGTRSTDVDVAGPFTIDTVLPTILSVSPLDDATGTNVTDNLVVVFSKSMAAVGTFELYDVTGTAVEESFNLATGAGGAGGTAVFSTTTLTNDTLTINPFASLTASNSYASHLTSLTDTLGNALADITDDTTWNFTTASASSLYTTDFSEATDAYPTDQAGERIFQANDATPITITHLNTQVPNASLTNASDGRIAFTSSNSSTNMVITIPFSSDYSSVFLTVRSFVAGGVSAGRTHAMRWLQSDKSTQTGTDFETGSSAGTFGYIHYNGTITLPTPPGDAAYLQIDVLANDSGGNEANIYLYDLNLVA